jgi:hypothetical protein
MIRIGGNLKSYFINDLRMVPWLHSVNVRAFRSQKLYDAEDRTAF